mgnify:CR=1 FL=1
MQGNTKKKKLIGSMVSAAVVIGLLGIFLAILLVPLLIQNLGDGAVVLFFGIYAVVIAAVIVGILLALRQRIKEIEGGEEDVASQY